MEFPSDINQLFSERISIMDHDLVAGRRTAGRPDLQAQIATIIDELGRASAKAQQLTAPITSASKLQSQKHQLYLMKDGESNGGRGVVVGFLKVGHKKLFLLDVHGMHVEAEPLCVLDFFIAENVQRHGYGLELFDFMLQHKNLEPVLMAFDRPSPKLLSFLAKHYFLTQSVPQVNNFVVFEEFFLNLSDSQLRKVALKKPDGEIKPYSVLEREAVRQEQRSLPWPFAPPFSPQRSVSSHSVGSSPSRMAPQAAPATPRGSDRDQNPQSPLIDRCRAKRTSYHLSGSQRGLVARGSLYSRHTDSRAIGQLERCLPGVRPLGDRSHSRGHSDTDRSLPLSPLPQCVSKKVFIHSQNFLDRTSTQLVGDNDTRGAEEAIRVLNNPLPEAEGSLVRRRHLSVKEGDPSRRGWTWTVGKNCYTAQWVKQKQEYRSTQPW